jgi:hypothetical protein
LNVEPETDDQTLRLIAGYPSIAMELERPKPIGRKRRRVTQLLLLVVACYFSYWFIWPYVRMAHRLGVVGMFTVPKSQCLTQPGFKPVDRSPKRSPLLVADHLISYAKGKVIFEVGTRNGDILSCVNPHAKQAYSAEIDPEYCVKLEERGLTVLCDDFRKFSPSSLPGLPEGEVPDVFFWWPMMADTQNEEWMLHIRDALWKQDLGAGKRVIIAFDHNWPRDRLNLQYMWNKYGVDMNGERHEVNYAENRHWRASGTFTMLHLKLDPPRVGTGSIHASKGKFGETGKVEA